MILPEKPDSSRIWHIESNGVNPVDTASRHGTPRDLFWIWFAGNLSFTYIVIGAVVWSYGLSLWQSLLAIIVGLSSFVAIGFLGLPGQSTGLPTMAYSSRYFGTRGNRMMSIVSWVNMVGWETVVLIIASYAIAMIFHLVLHTPTSAAVLCISLAIAAFAELSLAALGHATIEFFQKWVSYIFGGLSLLVMIALLPHVNWHLVVSHPQGPWLKGVVPAITAVVAVSALSWVTTASDYTRYLPQNFRRSAVVKAAAWGSIIPTAMLMIVGLLLAQTAPTLANSANPVQFLLGWLPGWAQIPYVFITLGGMLAGGVLCAYSSGLSLLAAGVKVPRSRTIGIDAVFSIGASLYVLLVSGGFLNNFEGFLSLVAALLAPWVAIALWHTHDTQQSFPVAAVISWTLGALLAVATTSTAIYSGPLAQGIFAGSSLGYFAGFVLTGALYGAWTHKFGRTPA